MQAIPFPHSVRSEVKLGTVIVGIPTSWNIDQALGLLDDSQACSKGR